MTCRLLPREYVPATLLTVVAACMLGYLRFAPVPGEAVAAVYRPDASLSAAIGRLAAGWQVLGVAAERPFPVLLLRAASADAAPAAPPAGAWLLLRAAGAGQCGQPSSQRT